MKTDRELLNILGIDPARPQPAALFDALPVLRATMAVASEAYPAYLRSLQERLRAAGDRPVRGAVNDLIELDRALSRLEAEQAAR